MSTTDPTKMSMDEHMTRLRELADSEGTRAVEYLRRARRAEADLAVTHRALTLALQQHRHTFVVFISSIGYLIDGVNGMMWGLALSTGLQILVGLA